MSKVSNIKPYLAGFYASDYLLLAKRRYYEWQRKLKRKPHSLDVFVKVDDPYSYLLLQVLGDLVKRFNIEINYHTVLRSQDDMFPEPELLEKYAIRDAKLLAELYSLTFPASASIPEKQTVIDVCKVLVAAESSNEYLSLAKEALRKLWFGELVQTVSIIDETDLHERLLINEAKLKQLGHYLGATIYFSGEWYWGVDRLDHLERRLIQLGRATKPPEHVYFNKTYQLACQGQDNGLRDLVSSAQNTPQSNQSESALTLYWSARSPYSYLALERAIELANHYNIPLEIKPVLPMLMRGLNVPKSKKMYIFLDTKREAKKLNLDYGRVADPLGAGVERCYALFNYAKQVGKANEYLLSFARAVNAQGIPAETDSGMQKIIERCGLDWHIAKTKLNDTSWQQWATRNMDELTSKGCWGVPTLCYRDVCVWGQDRLFVIENAIINAIRSR